MNTLIQGIENALKTAIEEYATRITDMYENVEIDKLEKLWNDVSENLKISLTVKKSSTKKSSSVSESEGDSCPYIFTKGQRDGEMCGAKPRKDMNYCSRHKKYEDIEQKPKKTLPQSKKTISSKTESKKSQPKIMSRVLRKNKEIDMLWHPETGFVFKSTKERVVVGKIEDNKVIELMPDDIDECKKWGFALDVKEEKVKEEKVKREKPKLSLAKKSKNLKKSITKTITGVNEDIEDILNEIQEPQKNEEEFGEEFEEEFEEEILEE